MEKEAYLLDVDYVVREGEPVLRLFLSDGNDPLLGYYEGFSPYFYVVPGEGEEEELEDSLLDLEFEDGDDRVKVTGVDREVKQVDNEDRTVFKTYVNLPVNVPKVKDRVKEWDEVETKREFDIPFYKRFLVDKGLKPGSSVKVEGDDFEPFDDEQDSPALQIDRIEQSDEKDIFETEPLAFDLEVLDDEIIMCSFFSQGFRKVLVSYDFEFDASFVEVVEDEEELLDRIVGVVESRDPDVLVGYNTDEFDFDVIRERFQHHGKEVKLGRLDERMKFRRRARFSAAELKGRLHIDLYPFVETIVARSMRSETLSLDSVAEEVLGENKEELNWEEMEELWREKDNLDMLAEYALKDSELAYKLSKSFLPQIFSLSSLVGLLPFDTCRTSYGQLVENFLLRKAHYEEKVAPNRPIQKHIKERRREGGFSGGFVYEPEEGLYEDIALFDFRSLYPTIIVSHNISPDTLDVEGCEDVFEVDVEESSYEFCQEEEGFLPGILSDLVEERYDIKSRLSEATGSSQKYRMLDNRQYALKILSNAFYGYLGYPSARWYSRECAEAVTYLGRSYIQDTIEKAEYMGFDIVYSDTDSVFISGRDVKERSDEFLEHVNSQLPEFMELEFEGYYPRGIFTSKKEGEGAKKKYALIDEEGNVKITGFEKVRRDWSKVAKETQEKVIRKVLEGRVEEAAEEVTRVVERLKDKEVGLDKLKIYTTMNKKPENYESKTPHSEAAKKAIERGLDVGAGDTIDYVVTSGAGSISDRSEITRFAEDYDPEYYVENQVIPAAIRVLKVFGYTEDQLKGEGRQSGLSKFAGD